MRAVTRALGTVRELDVLQTRLRSLAAEAAPERALAVEFVDAAFDRWRRRARARMMACFARVDMDRLDHALARLVARLERSGTVADRLAILGDLPVLTKSLNRMSVAVERLNDLTHVLAPYRARSGHIEDEAVAPPGDTRVPQVRVPPTATIDALLDARAAALIAGTRDVLHLPILPSAAPDAAEGLHRVRIAAKKLRYELEILSPVMGEAGRRLIKRLRTLQAEVGTFHDDAVLDAALHEVMTRCLDRGRTLLASEIGSVRADLQREVERREHIARSAVAALRAGEFASDLEAVLAPARRAGHLEGASETAPTFRSPCTERRAADAPEVRRA